MINILIQFIDECFEENFIIKVQEKSELSDAEESCSIYLEIFYEK